jgi:dolichyl-phosphate-mannose--protein O-mannosyl transferase
LLLVESRYALNNVYLLSFGLLGHLFFLRALKAQFLARWLWLGLAGIGFGASAAIKWNGLGFLLGTYLTWAVGWGLHWIDSWRSVQAKEDAEVGSRKVVQSPLQNLSQLHLGHVVVCLALIPALTYYLSWTPYMWVDSSSPPWDVQRFVDLNLETLNYHARVGGPEVHPYCSRWFTWPLMLRPIAYFYQTTHGINEPPAIVGPPLPQEQGFERAIYDVHAMGNPILWWLSTAAMVLAIVLLGYQLWRWLTASRVVAGATTSTVSPTFGTRGWLLLFVVLNWTANFLPWVRITRCIFLYHYMASFLFAVLALALWVDRWLQSQYYWYRVTAIASVMLVLIAFIFWMPLFLGLPVSPTELQLLRWLPSWV